MTNEKIFVPNFIDKMTKSFKILEKQEEGVIEDDTLIRVNSAISKVSLVYEKLRNVVDYNDEHLLRKNAIFRILKRLILIERRKDGLGLLLIQELIRINYLPNNTIPENRAKEVDSLLKKYLTIDRLGRQYYKNRSASKLINWFLQIAACEVEDILFDFRQRQALVTAMVKVLKQDVELPENINLENQNLLFNITVLRSLLKSDQAILRYYLLSELQPNFFTADPSVNDLAGLVKNWEKTEVRMNYYFDHPLKNKLNKIGRKYAVYFLILRDILLANQEEIDQIITHPRLLEEKINEICSKHYREIRVKVVRSVIHAIIYIFTTKMLLALLIEVPLDYLLEQSLNYLTLIINVLFPPFLMLAIGLFIRLPKKRNTEKIIKRIKGIVYQTSKIETRYHLRPNIVRRKVVNFFFNLFYLITYGITFGIVIWFLNELNFNILSGAIFIFFLCVISFFAITIRLKARELIVLDRKEGFINLLFDFFSLPIIRIGHWLSIRLSKINVFVFIMDFIIEAPLKIILEAIENWFSFIREKKEEIY